MRVNHKRGGFTLVELIVVIGILSFLAVVFIFPTFGKVRGKAYDTVCISNLRQIGQALLMYAQDYDGLVPPYCNLDDALFRGPRQNLNSLRAKRWGAAFDPYVRGSGIFFCPKDPFAGLPPAKTPCQGVPSQGDSDCDYARNLDHSVTSYIVCPEVVVRGQDLGIEEWSAKGYYLTTDIHQNMTNFPREWLFAPSSSSDDTWHWSLGVGRLHAVAVYLRDRIHFIDSQTEIELFCDGHVEIHRPCSVERELVEYFKRYAQGESEGQ